jgi:Acetyltransferase (GNAT) domain
MTCPSRPTSDRVKARLIEDGGAAASDAEQFFRSPPFLEAEAVTHTLAIEGDSELRLPLIVRPIESTGRLDAISPYGYPGADRSPDDPPDPAEIDWSDTGLVSIFVRDRIGQRPCFAGGTVRSHVHVAEGEGGVRKRLREQIRRNERRGWETRLVPGREVEMGQLRAFERAYAETMARTEAAQRYLHPTSYFARLLLSERSWLLLAEREGVALAGAIAAASDGYLHYYLGGTADEALSDSPMKNLFWAMIAQVGELGLPVNLGGGVTPGDSLDEFKRGFANAEAPWHTHELVCEATAFEELSATSGEAPEGFFPAYRA